MKLIDLTRTLGGLDHPPWPKQVQPFVYHEFNSHEEHGRTNGTVNFNVHEGTHIDPPYHFVKEGQTIDEIPLDRLLGPGFIFRMEPVEPGEAVDLRQVLASATPPSDISGYFILIDTGWGSEEHRLRYYDKAPYLSQDLAEWLVASRVRGVGLVNPPDKVEPPRKNDAPIHRTLLGGGVLIIECLTNLSAIPDGPFTLAALPLKLHRGCGGPARVVAVVGDEVG